MLLNLRKLNIVQWTIARLLTWLDRATRKLPQPRTLAPAPIPQNNELTRMEREQLAIAEAVGAHQAAVALAEPAPQIYEPIIAPPPKPFFVFIPDELPSLPELPDLPAPAPEQDNRTLTCETQDTPPTHPPKSRAAQVEAALDEAWGNGLRTYDPLIEFVRLKTGTGTSRRVVSAWKKARGHIEAA